MQRRHLSWWASLLGVAALAPAGCVFGSREASERADAVQREPDGRCGKEVVNDIWADGDLDRTYRPECYSWALKSIPPEHVLANVRAQLQREQRRAQRRLSENR